jgi:hypothetical protein
LFGQNVARTHTQRTDAYGVPRAFVSREDGLDNSTQRTATAADQYRFRTGSDAKEFADNASRLRVVLDRPAREFRRGQALAQKLTQRLDVGSRRAGSRAAIRNEQHSVNHHLSRNLLPGT